MSRTRSSSPVSLNVMAPAATVYESAFKTLTCLGETRQVGAEPNVLENVTVQSLVVPPTVKVKALSVPTTDGLVPHELATGVDPLESK